MKAKPLSNSGLAGRRDRRLGARDPKPDWFEPVVKDFEKVSRLRPNWDGEGALPIDQATIDRALAAVRELLPPEAPAPNVVPVSNSGLQIEWHRNEKDLEVEFRPNGEAEFYYFDEATQEEKEGPVGPNFTNLKKYLPQLW